MNHLKPRAEIWSIDMMNLENSFTAITSPSKKRIFNWSRWIKNTGRGLMCWSKDTNKNAARDSEDSKTVNKS